MQTQVEPAQVSYKEVERIPSDRGDKHRIMDIEVAGATSPEVPLDVSQLGVRRLVHLAPQPLDGFWTVVWNGDTNDPVLSLDPYPEGETMTVRLEVRGR